MNTKRKPLSQADLLHFLAAAIRTAREGARQRYSDAKCAEFPWLTHERTGALAALQDVEGFFANAALAADAREAFHRACSVEAGTSPGSDEPDGRG